LPQTRQATAAGKNLAMTVISDRGLDFSQNLQVNVVSFVLVGAVLSFFGGILLPFMMDEEKFSEANVSTWSP